MNDATMHPIFDIAPPEIGSQEIDVRGTKIKVQGIDAGDWVTLYKRWPELIRLAATGGSAPDGGGFSPVDAVQMEAAVCAAGFGKLGDEAVERAVINNLSRDERQLLMITAINLSRPADALGPLLDGGAVPETGNSG